jgi:hypothetical protein
MIQTSTINTSGVKMKFRASHLPVIAFSLASLLPISDNLQAQPIAVPNYSFESPAAPSAYPYVNIFVDSWQKATKPAYFDAVEQNSGLLWDQTAAVFFGPGAYGNMPGIQGAYLFSFPQVSLFQDYESVDYNDAVPSHDFNATFEIGKAYSLTVGVFGKGFSGNMTEGSMLGLSLYYRDGANLVTIGAPTIITYTAAGFPVGGALNLQDYQVNLPTVQAGDAWAGQHIGIKLESIYGMGDGYWDIDNVRLVAAVPEPSSLGLLGVGGGLLFARLRARKRS